MQQIKLFWLGRPRIELAGRQIELETRKATALLAYLSLSDQPQPRERLAALFWPEYDTERAYGNLRRVLWAVNKALQNTEKEWLESGRETVGPVDRTQVQIDIDLFRELLQQAASHNHPSTEPCPECLTALAQAAHIYTGDFLDGLNLRDSAEFDDWQYLQRDALRQELANALEQLTLGYAAQNELEPAIRFARQWVGLDRLNECAQAALIRLLARSGQRGAALRHYEDFARLLQSELAETPDDLTLALYEEIRGRRQALPTPILLPCGPTTSSPPDVPVQGARQLPPTSLPNPSTPFIARAEELADIVSSLQDPSVRLLTLLGPGGSGKTRLAVQAARELSAESDGIYPHGIHYVSLAPLTSPDHLVGAIATALQFSFTEGRPPQELLIRYLAGKRLLLVLDNFEHLLPGAALLAELLDAAPGVKLLVTSRERLNLSGEWVFEVEGMRYPLDDSTADLETYSSVCMFVESARRSSFTFHFSEEERPLLARITRLVTGMPLAIELAATWVRSLSLAEIAAEIEENLDFLSSAHRNLPERHQSLRAVFEYSWNLLDPEEQRVFARLAVFRGGFTRQAALAVTGASLRLLTSLVDQSLVKISRPGRYEIHELLRQYAEEALAKDPSERESVLDAHARYTLETLAEKVQAINDTRVKRTLAEIDEELENIRGAWHWAARQGMIELLGRAMAPLREFFVIKTYLQEGREALHLAAEAFARALTKPAERTPERLMWYQNTLAFEAIFCYLQYDAEPGSRLVQQVLDISRENGSAQALALANLLKISFAHQRELPGIEADLEKYLETIRETGFIPYLLWGLGIKAQVKIGLGKVDEARQVYQEALELSRRQGNIAYQGEIMGSLGNLAEWTGDLEEARKMYGKALSIVREIGFRWGTSLFLDYLGYVSRLLGDYSSAISYHEQSLAASQENGDPLGIAGSYDNLGLVAYDQGDWPTARAQLTRALEIRRWVADAWNIAVSLENLASLDMREGLLDSAAQRLAESLAIRREIEQDYGLARTLVRMGRLASLRSQTEEAVGYYREGIQVSVQSKAWPIVIGCVIGLAQLDPLLQDAETALLCLRFCADHPSTLNEDRLAAEEAAQRLASSLPASVVERARQRAAQVDFNQLVRLSGVII